MEKSAHVVPMLMIIPGSMPEDHANTRVVTAAIGMEMDTRSKYQPAIQRMKGRVEDGYGPAVKKLKRMHVEVEMVLRQTAEMVMVLVGVAALQGGAQPSSPECQLVAHAYEKLATLVTISNPQDVVSKHALQSLMQQLIVPPLPLLACLAAKHVANQSPTPTLMPAISSLSSLSRIPAQNLALANTPLLSPSKSISPSLLPILGFFTYLPSGATLPLLVASSAQAFEPEPTMIPTPLPNTSASTLKVVLEASAPLLVLEKAKQSALEQVQMPSSSLDNVAPSVILSSIPALNLNVHVATSITLMNAMKAKSRGRTSPIADAQSTTMTVSIKEQRGSQGPKALARQHGLRNTVPEQLAALDPLEIHRQIAMAVHVLLKPYIITTTLSKIIGNYMSTSIPCGICKVAMNTTNNVLVCDGCECGFHLQCLQLSSTANIPKGDWYCSKCVTTNAGCPQAPKYGLLRHGPDGQFGSKNSWSMQIGHGSNTSMGQIHRKLLLQSRKKEVGGVQESVQESLSLTVFEEAYLDFQPKAVARRHSMEEYAKCKQISACLGGISKVEVSDQSLKLEWLGPVVSSGQEKLYYSACSKGGVTLRLQDAAFLIPETPDAPPYIARLQALWEDKNSGQKWVKVNWCYYPSDLPINMDRPMISDPREVYESNHSDNNLVGSIQGPCLVLSPLKYHEELNQRSKNPKDDPIPLFLCQWFYDASKQQFRASSHSSS